MRIADCRLQIADCRRGSSIIEVLFAILIATVGLLAAVSVFPVAAAIARRGNLFDAAGVHGRSAVHAYDAQGMRRPDHWYQWLATATPPQFVTIGTPGVGYSYCIDSRFVTANAPNVASFPYEWQHQSITTLNNLPTVGTNVAPRMVRVAYLRPAYLDLNNMGQPSQDMAKTIAGNRLQAERTFTLDDDLAYWRPGVDEFPANSPILNHNDDSIPAMQQPAYLPKSTTSQVSKRQTRGEFSWMATLVPKIDFNQLGLTQSDQYVLSVVVFHQRPADLAINGEYERVLNVYVVDGTTGGEVQIYWPATAQNQTNDDLAEIRLKLKANDWIMLAGNIIYTDTTSGMPVQKTVPRFQWYRVSDCDDVSYEAATATPALPARYERTVTLIGQDWIWSSLSNQQATIVEGVIGVYEKTVRLEYGEAL